MTRGFLTAADLIAELQKLPPEMPVVAMNGTVGDWCIVLRAEVMTTAGCQTIAIVAGWAPPSMSLD
jgi:hypothetical protein